MALSALGPLELRRDALLDRIERASPRLLAMIAPAGFGKSTLARQLISGKNAAICDVAGIIDDLDLARRIVPALAAENPARTQALTQRELMLGDGGTSVAERVNIALEAWKEHAPQSFFIFENAEHIARNAAAREFFARLMTHRPPNRTIVICAREHLRVHLTRFAAPHEILTLRAEDLAFDRNEVARVFNGKHHDESMLARIESLSQGWPIAVFLLKRFENEGRMEHLLQTLDDVAFDELHDYLADQVLASLEPQLVRGLFACACINRATMEDLQTSLRDDDVVRSLAQFARESPFLTRNGTGEFEVHPMLATLLLEHREEHRNELLARTARAFEERGNFQRAAELHLARGDHASAAHALGQHEVLSDHAPSMAYARVLASLDRTLVQRYPRLWAVTALLRVFCVDTEELLDEAESLWRTLAPHATPMERFYILVFRALFLSFMGLLHEAVELLESFAAENDIGDQPQKPLDGYVQYALGVMRARSGMLTRAQRDLTTALPFVAGMDAMASGTFLALGVDIARVRGEVAVARQFIDRALTASEKSGLQNFVAFNLAEAAFGAWFAGDEAALLRYGARLEEAVERSAARGLGYFTSILRGRSADPRDVDMLKWVACGRIIAAATAPEPGQALRHARAAVDAAMQYGSPFMECLSHICLAYFDDLEFENRMRAAINAAERCDSAPLVQAVYAIADRKHDFGMLAPFMRRLEFQRAEHVPMLEISLTAGTVRARGEEVALTERELALLVALAIKREVVPRSRLADWLWPDVDDYAARNALSVCLHRLRNHLGADDAVVRIKDGYTLHDDVRVDLWEIDRIVTKLRGRRALGEAERTGLERAHQSLAERRPERMLQWQWFEPVERHLSELRMEAAHRLAQDALRRGEPHVALEYARAMIAHDPCDEGARHAAITAHLLLGERAAALRQYRQYKETLANELQLEPSVEIRSLVGLE